MVICDDEFEIEQLQPAELQLPEGPLKEWPNPLRPKFDHHNLDSLDAMLAVKLTSISKVVLSP